MFRPLIECNRLSWCMYGLPNDVINSIDIIGQSENTSESHVAPQPRGLLPGQKKMTRVLGPYSVQVTIYRRLLIGRDGHLDQSVVYDIS